jgi:hypothetical protein
MTLLISRNRFTLISQGLFEPDPLEFKKAETDPLELKKVRFTLISYRAGLRPTPLNPKRLGLP